VPRIDPSGGVVVPLAPFRGGSIATKKVARPDVEAAARAVNPFRRRTAPG
jgi:hypothetical protein